MKSDTPIRQGSSAPSPGGPSARPGTGLAGLVGRAIAAVVTGALLVVGLMFSMVLFVVALVGGAAVFGWMWWKVRRMLRQARQDPRFDPMAGATGGFPPRDDNVIEGEVVHEEWKDGPGPRG